MENPLASDLEHVLAQTGGLWEALRGARVFLTGGTGFFGCWLLETFLWANDRLRLGASIVVLTRDATGFATKAPHLARHPAVTLHDGDVRTFAFPEGPFTHVIHAATTSSSAVAPAEMFETIVDGTHRALDFARHAGATRFLLTSSGAVYGRQPPELTQVPEDYRGGPDSSDASHAYAEGKRAAEMLCAVYADGQLHPTIARCFAFVGPYLPLDAHFAIGNFIRDALQGGPIRVVGDGTPYRSYLYAADLAIWLWTILLRGQSMRPYNVGSEVEISISDLAHLVGRRVVGDSAVRVAGTAISGAAAARYVPSTGRARSELGLQLTIDLERALTRTVDWHRRRVSSTYVNN
ncbi:MAG TPA: NAD-dependent epimerase/dehydratase family protein [Vicinamibacterales bacterium]|nr:NAD-dependent epimerase/dehydratase family protein [Vicinamibacterales bacterium]